MAFLNSLTVASTAAQPLAPQPRAVPGPGRPQPDRSGAAACGVDRIDRPDAELSPNVAANSPGTSAHHGTMLPLLIAGGLLVGGAVLAGPALAGAGAALAEGGGLAEEGAAFAGGASGTGAAITEGAAAVGSAVTRSRAFLSTAAREAASEYRSGAARLTHVNYADPKEIGKFVGAQAWSATEELGRSSVVGAGLAGGAWAIAAATAAIDRLSGSATPNAGQR